jgi:hypothetical protein
VASLEAKEEGLDSYLSYGWVTETLPNNLTQRLPQEHQIKRLGVFFTRLLQSLLLFTQGLHTPSLIPRIFRSEQ